MNVKIYIFMVLAMMPVSIFACQHFRQRSGDMDKIKFSEERALLLALLKRQKVMFGLRFAAPILPEREVSKSRDFLCIVTGKQIGRAHV